MRRTAPPAVAPSLHARTRPAVTLALVCVLAASAGAQRRATAVPSAPSDKTIIHVLNRTGFGAAPGDIDRVRAMGLAAYVDQQLQPGSLSDANVDARLGGFATLAMSSEQIAQDYYLPAQMLRRQAQRAAATAAEMPPANPDMRKDRSPEEVQAAQAERRILVELSQQKVLRAAYSEKQLQEVMVDFWFNHFNVFAGKGQTRIYLTEYERDTIRPRVFGKFRDLLGAVAEAPAMLFYLDNWQSAAPEGTAMEETRAQRGLAGRRGRGAARAGRGATPPDQMRRRPTMADLPPALQSRRPRGVNENYARELMELHTLGVDGGYTQADVQEIARAFTGWTLAQPRQGGGFTFDPRMHDNGAKTFLGTTLKSGGGKQDGEQVLDVLAKHPSTARFIATKLARRFVADDPPKALVDRAAARFRESDGDIREVVRTILTSAEFYDPKAYRAKVKSPFEFVASAIRATSADARNAVPVVQSLRDLGMPLYGCQPPTGYSDRADAWVNTGALLNRMNFAVALASGTLRGIQTASSINDRSIAAAALAGDVSEATRATVAKAAAAPQAIALLLGSPEFQRR